MKKFLSVVLCIVLGVSVFAGCEESGTAVDETSSPSASDPAVTPEQNQQPVLVADGDIIKSLNLSNVGPEVKDTALDIMNVEDGAKTIYVKDYNAKGDGVTDDRQAILKAVSALKKLPKGSTLEFEANKTYYCGNKGTALSFASVKNYIVKGSNTTILIEAPAQFLAVQNCENFVLQGFNFNYKTKPFAYTVSVHEVTNTKKEYSIVATMDRSLGIDSKYTISDKYQINPIEFFGLLNREDGRWHMSVKSIEPVDAAAYKYKIYFNSTTAFHPIDDSLKYVKEMGMIVPMPEVGHLVEQACNVTGNTDIMMKDCNIWSACKFMFYIGNNEGKVIFDNVNVTPDPAEETFGKLKIVGWRDGFHCKENRAQLIWKDCTLEYVYDDMFNICCSVLKIKSIEGDKLNLVWPERNNGPYGYIKEGDTVEFYGTNSKYLGKSTVTSVSGDTITIKDNLEGLKKNVYVAVSSLAAPNSQIINCKIQGTIRFKTPMYIYNSDIHITRMWLAFEQFSVGIVEGPCLNGLLFSNCRFTFDNQNDKYIEIFSANTAGAKAMEKGTMTQEEVFHIKNVVFFHCDIDENQIVCKNAEQYCDDVYKIIK